MKVKKFLFAFATAFALFATQGLYAEIIVPDEPVNIVRSGSPAFTVTSVGDYNSETGANLFNGVMTDRWCANYASAAQGKSSSATIAFTSIRPAVNAYRIWFNKSGAGLGDAPKAWTFQGSNDGENWTVLDTRTDETGWTVGEFRTYTFSNVTPYSQYRIHVTDCVSSSRLLVFSELELYQFEDTGLMLVDGVPSRLGKPMPAYGSLSGLSVGDGLTIDVESKAIVNPDNGDTWSVESFELTDYAGKVIKKGTADELPYAYTHAGYASLVWTWKSAFEAWYAQTDTDITVPSNAGQNEITESSVAASLSSKATVLFNDKPGPYTDGTSSRWLVLKADDPQPWFEYRFLTGRKTVTGLKIYPSASTGRVPTSIAVFGSNDGVTYDEIVRLEKTDVEIKAGKVLRFDNTAAYERYRVQYLSGGDGKYYSTGQVEFYTIYAADSIHIVGEPKSVGAPMPGYGFTGDLIAGTQYGFDGPAETIQVDDVTRSACVGSSLTVNGDEPIIGTGTHVSYTHVAGNAIQLKWLYATEYLQAFSAKGSGSVSVEEKWAHAGEEITVTATVGSDGAPFALWTGDVPEGVDPTSATLTYVADRAHSLVANFATPLYVKPDGDDANDGSDWDHALASPVTACGRASAGVTVYVKAGEYVIPGNVWVVDKATTFVAVDGHAVCRVDETAGGRGVVVNDPKAVLDGFDILGASSDDGAAAGLKLLAGTVTNCVIAGAAATSANSQGGGVYMEGTAVLVDCVVSNNTSAFQGGGVYSRGGSICACLIAGNTASVIGGGVLVAQDAAACAFADNRVLGNSCTKTGDYGGGGLVAQSAVDVVRCLFAGNTATGGGGAALLTDGATMSDCVVTNNTGTRGGGVFAYGAKMSRCVFADNTANDMGGGLFFETDNGSADNCLFVRNRVNGGTLRGGGGMAQRGGRTVNCTFVDNFTKKGAQSLCLINGSTVRNLICRSGDLTTDLTSITNVTGLDGAETAAANLANCCICDPWFAARAPANSTAADPMFVDAANGDYRLRAGSPCVNGGAKLDYTAESLDLDGNPRIFNFGKRSGKPDMGCYESPWGIPGMMLRVR